MKNEQDIFLLVESYVNGTLTNEERIAFEELLSENNEFKETAELSKATQKAIQMNKLFKIKNIIKEVHTEKTKGKYLKRIALFAGLLAICGLGFYLFTANKQITTKPDYNKVHPVLTTKSEPKVTEVQQMTPVNEVNKKKLKERDFVEKSSVSVAPLSNEPVEMQVISRQSEVSTESREPEKKLSEAVSEPSEQKKVLENVCAHSFLEAHTIIEPSCMNQSTGRIIVSGFKGGKAPYYVRMFNNKNQVVLADNLPAGTYSLLISDQHQCERLIEGIKVKEENCKKEYEVNTTNGEVVDWGIATQTTTLSVFNENEIVYFYKQFNHGEHILWNGISSTGTNQNGYFVFLLQYQDGTVQNGSITVLK